MDLPNLCIKEEDVNVETSQGIDAPSFEYIEVKKEEPDLFENDRETAQLIAAETNHVAIIKMAEEIENKSVIHIQEKLFKCSVCDCTIECRTISHRYVFIYNNKTFECKLCNYKSIHKRNMEIHTQNHISKFFTCKLCTLKNLEHKLIDTGDKPLKRDYKTMQRNKLLLQTLIRDKRRHEVIHSRGEFYKCDFCNYKGLYRGYVQKHMMRHTREKPFQCTTCEFKTATRSNLQRHSMIHTGKKLYACEFCSYKAVLKSQLQMHRKWHIDTNESNMQIK